MKHESLNVGFGLDKEARAPGTSGIEAAIHQYIFTIDISAGS